MLFELYALGNPHVQMFSSVGDRPRGDCGPRCGRALGDDLPIPVPQGKTEARSSSEVQTALPKQGQSLWAWWVA